MASTTRESERPRGEKPRAWSLFFGPDSAAGSSLSGRLEKDQSPRPKWSMGILNDKSTEEVPGSVLLLTGQRNEPLGLRNAPARTSHSSFPASEPVPRSISSHAEKKKTKDGTIVLEPQPDDSHNDPLNWPSWRRDMALISLGLYCMLGGGLTPILAAGFTNVAETYKVGVSRVALTTGLYMMGLGVGSVIASPTAILYGKRPVYLLGCIVGIACACWCAASPSYNSLLIARIFQGMAISPVECLPSATIAEIFFLHERAYRIGTYTLLLLGGKNLVPLVSAAIIQRLGWRWVFWMVAIISGFCWFLLFLFVPETFWDRTPRPRSKRPPRVHMFRRASSRPTGSVTGQTGLKAPDGADDSGLGKPATQNSGSACAAHLMKVSPAPHRNLRVGFAPEEADVLVRHDTTGRAEEQSDSSGGTLRRRSITMVDAGNEEHSLAHLPVADSKSLPVSDNSHQKPAMRIPSFPARHEFESRVCPAGGVPPTPGLHNFNSPYYTAIERPNSDYLDRGQHNESQIDGGTSPADMSANATIPGLASLDPEASVVSPGARPRPPPRYTSMLKEGPRQTFVQQLRPCNGRLHNDNWLRVAIRPFILFLYPAVLWSSIVYACSIGWLIVLSESVADIYRNKDTYDFSALSTGLIYISPFIGGILGTAVAGKVSDIIVRAMTRRNGGLYEPEFRLVMAGPVAIATVIGLMGFGWSAQSRDAWIVPTIFFGVISFGCSLGSTTAITFCVDSYRQYAGEALVTLNFSKNIFHGLVFSLFFPSWLTHDGSKTVFLCLGGIQLALLLLTIPMYIYGKRARMWTVRKNLMEKF
ncbi:MAG: hypothetical protein M1818_008300 [Claussenomyces sp. TS43310]|nr:MAG: hypothetical protein M1818_008300 [Claussenomyces sp. TS43310]